MGSAVAPRHAMPPPSRWARFDAKVDADTVTFAAPDTSSPPPLPAPASLASSTEPRAMVSTAEPPAAMPPPPHMPGSTQDPPAVFSRTEHPSNRTCE